ncbi:MAG: AraC family transcriptional regulator [Anaerolineaceae bacterium]|nr:AraC family transcriptional regulator [Anaerolineaceae bacterium]
MEERSDAVQRMQDYIASHLLEAFSLKALAKNSQYSPWHAHRLFVKVLKMSPGDYARKLKLSSSALELRDSKVLILDLALKYGYASVDGYQRAFRKEFGCNPREYAKNPLPITLFIPYGVKKTNRKVSDMEENTIFVQLIHKPERRAIIRRARTAKAYYQYCEEVGCDVWGILKSIKSINGEPYAYWLPPQMVRHGTSVYVQGVEVSPEFAAPLPDGFEWITLPESDYLLFQGEAYDDTAYEDAIGSLWRAIAKYDPARLGFSWNKDAPKIQMEPIGKRGYIELHPVRPLGQAALSL